MQETDAPTLQQECAKALQQLPSPVDCAALEGIADEVTRELAATYASDDEVLLSKAKKIEDMLEVAAANDGFYVIKSDFLGLPNELLSVLLFEQRYIMRRRTVHRTVSLVALAYAYAATQRRAADIAQIWYLTLALLVPRSVLGQLDDGVVPTANILGRLTGWALPLWVLEIRADLLRRMIDRAA
jgi:hypothetical protein